MRRRCACEILLHNLRVSIVRWVRYSHGVSMHLRAHKVRLIAPTKVATYFLRCAGTARFAYNWALNHSAAFYREHGKTISDFDLKKAWNAHRKATLPWSYEVTKHASDSGVLNFCAARSNLFESIKKCKTGGKGHFRKPHLKSKHRSKKSFAIYGVDFRAEGYILTIPKLGPVKMTESVRFPGKIKFVTISEQGGHWFASFQIELSEDYVYPHRCETQATVGVDVGLHTHLTLSTGEKKANPKLYRRFERKLKKAQRALSRKQKGSKNRAKAKANLSKLNAALSGLRADHLHQMTTLIVKQYRFIGVEDLSVANMLKNHSLARAISDASFGEILRQLRYKTEWAGGYLAIANRFFPSSKLCSVCSYKNEELVLSNREWICPQCGTCHDRDVNAAQNLETVACGLRETINACVTNSPLEGKDWRSQRKPRGMKPVSSGEDSGMAEAVFRESEGL